MFLKQNVSTYVIVGPFVTSANIMTTAVTTAMVLDISQGGLVSTGQAVTTVAIVSTQTMTFRVNLSSASVATLGRWEMIARQTVGIKMNYLIVGNVVSSNYYDQMFGTSAIGGGGASTVTEASIWGYTTRNLTSFGVTLGADIWSVTTKAVTAIPAGYSTLVASDVWSVASRTLTSWGGISTAAPSTLAAADVWAYSSRLLTSGQAAADAVWANTSRTLTSWGGISTVAGGGSTVTIPDIWAYSTRTLTSGPASTWGPVDVWSYSSRLLTSGAVAQSTFTAADVWSVASRTLTSTPPSTWGPTDVWNFTTRTLTSGAAVAPDVWLNSTRALTTGSVVAPDVWNHSTRSLTTASVVWTESSRTLTSTPPSTWGALDVWGYTARTLTSADAVWSDLLETTVTYKQGMRGLTAAVLGNSTGGGTTQVKFTNVGSTTTRLTYDVTTAGQNGGIILMVDQFWPVNFNSMWPDRYWPGIEGGVIPPVGGPDFKIYKKIVAAKVWKSWR